jgi:hypothetical protein
MTLLDQAKELLRIPEMWERRHWPRPPANGRWKEVFRPYEQDDSRKSGSVFDDGRAFKDFKSGEVFDAPALLARVEGLAMPDACREFIKLAGVSEVRTDSEPERRSYSNRRRREHRTSEPEARRSKPVLPNLRDPNSDELETIARLRGFSIAATELATCCGTLKVATHRGHACWAIIDDSCWNCQFRRLDGEPFDFPSGKLKTVSIAGGWASWPIGAANLGDTRAVLLVEGSGDFLAAHELIFRECAEALTGVVAMTGAANWIPSDAFALLRGRAVRIIPHIDTSRAGERAALRWETQLMSAGIETSCFDLRGLTQANGDPATDLNELLFMAPGELSELGAIAAF